MRENNEHEGKALLSLKKMFAHIMNGVSEIFNCGSDYICMSTSTSTLMFAKYNLPNSTTLKAKYKYKYEYIPMIMIRLVRNSMWEDRHFFIPTSLQSLSVKYCRSNSCHRS